jgi:GNAT superfamily N-acetyltransferase
MSEKEYAIGITIEYLANRPEFLDEIARLSWHEWQEVYQRREHTFAEALKNYQERTNIDRLPLTLIALHDDQHGFPIARPASLVTLPSVGDSRRKVWRPMPNVIGMVSLKFHDMDTRPDLDPWLGGLLVLPEWRKRGVGTMLMRRAIEEARRLNVPRLYLWTSSAEGLYHKLGWQVVERTEYFGKKAVVMECDL